jgi:hypothetical protein
LFGLTEIGVGVGIGIGFEPDDMSFGHERLDVHRAATEYVGYAVREEPAEYAAVEIDSDADTDSDPELSQPNQRLSAIGRTERLLRTRAKAGFALAPAPQRRGVSPVPQQILWSTVDCSRSTVDFRTPGVGATQLHRNGVAEFVAAGLFPGNCQLSTVDCRSDLFSD